MYFKYLSPERLDVLENARIRFSQGSILNDPHELRPNTERLKEIFANSEADNRKPVRKFYYRFLRQSYVTKDVRNKIRKYRKSNPAQFREMLVELIRPETDAKLDAQWKNRFDNSMLILSLSKQRDNQLMWSHYAAAHKGYVIGFDPEIITQHFVKNYSSSLPFELAYSNKRYRVIDQMFHVETMPTPVERDGSYFIQQKIKFDFPFDLLSTKSLDWAYEEEVRYFSPAASGETVPETAQATCPVVLYRFPSKAVRQIIIGGAADLSFIAQIQELRNQNYPKAELYRAVPDAESFTMQIEPLINTHPMVRSARILQKHGMIDNITLFDTASPPE